MFRHIKKLWAIIALLSIEMLVVIALFTGALLTFAYLIRKVIVLQETSFDQSVFLLLDSLVNERNNSVVIFFTNLGSHNVLIPAYLGLIAYFLVRKHKWYSIKIPAIALSSLALMFGLKYLFGRQRPDVPLLFEADGLSFPSGHAIFSITFYGLLIYIVYKLVRQKWLKWLTIVKLASLILVIGFTRVYLRVHYATDVIAGFCVGFLWLVFAIWILNRMEKYSRRKIDPAVQPTVASNR